MVSWHLSLDEFRTHMRDMINVSPLTTEKCNIQGDQSAENDSIKTSIYDIILVETHLVREYPL